MTKPYMPSGTATKLGDVLTQMSWQLPDSGHVGLALTYASVSVLAGLAAVVAGSALGRARPEAMA